MSGLCGAVPPSGDSAVPWVFSGRVSWAVRCMAQNSMRTEGPLEQGAELFQGPGAHQQAALPSSGSGPASWARRTDASPEAMQGWAWYRHMPTSTGPHAPQLRGGHGNPFSDGLSMASRKESRIK